MKISKKKMKKKIHKKLAPPIKRKAKIKVKLRAMAKSKMKNKAKIKPKKMVKKPKIIARKVTQLQKLAKPVKTIKTIKAVLPKKRIGAKPIFGPVDVKPYSPKKNEEYMNKKQLTHFQEILLKWKEQLMEDVDRTMHHMKDEASNYPDPVDRASQEEEFSLELRTRDRERKLLKKIEETLLRISEQDYGYCDDCGAEIGLRRLEARPTATQCIECKTISEMREKQIGDG